MARLLITGSSDGIGALMAKRLISQGHQVVLHARNAQRAADAQAACPGAHACLIGDLTSIEQTRQLAADANKHGPYDAVVHNAGVWSGPNVFPVNTLAPYVLTCLMDRPKRLVFVSSGLHRSGRGKLGRPEDVGYGDSKLHDIMLAKGFAKRWPEVASNAADPGWVPTKMGGNNAPGSIEASVDCFISVALGQGEAKEVTAKYFQSNPCRVSSCAPDAEDVGLQDALFKQLADKSGVEVPLTTA
ncbi:short-chain dehydrogenase/reductase SDR [Coniella lustricola]|uniref:Short-chain dehydrogenase/reductase SDR n=1 Tax=Coniella lustricola TaxID=2025994 RepID=A0A2T2ZY82_9PEZI|nr:short-chain dehydrogenase/reductase SDR [Coniella lustricola]